MKLVLCLFVCFLTSYATANQFTRFVVSVLDVYAHEMLNSADNETECIKQLKLYHSGLKQKEIWAAKMMDSSGKIQSGVMSANLYFIGNFDECLDIKHIGNGSHVEGQYCRTYVIPTEKTNECVEQNFFQKYSVRDDIIQELKPYVKLNWDSCFPEVCRARELQSLWDYAEERHEVQFHIRFNDDLCTSHSKEKIFPLLDVIIIGTFVVIGAICLSSTIYDVLFFRRQETKRLQWFIAFSYYTNGKRLLTIRKEEDDSKLTCLRGIKVISMVWIILGHRMLSNYLGTSINTEYAIEWLQHEENMFLMGAFASVDSFFVISGCLLIYLILIAEQNGIKINLFTFYFHRVIRLSPALIAMVLVYLGILKHLGSGPYWTFVNNIMIEPCEKHWWSTILYVQNYVNPDLPCLMQSWYLAVDTQLYFVSPLIFLSILKWPKFTISIVVGLIATSIGLTIRATYSYDISSVNFKAQNDYYMYIYNPTELRMGAWLVGLILGYIMFKTKDRKVKLNKNFRTKSVEGEVLRTRSATTAHLLNRKFLLDDLYVPDMLVIFLWILSLGAMLFITYLYIYFIKYKFTKPMVASFFSLSRVCWAVCLSWIIFSCSRGYGGFINTFLSLPIFNILGRLTYSMYLSHILAIYLLEGQRATPAYIANIIHFHGFWGDFMFTLALSVIWALTFESPATILEKSLFSTSKKNVLHIQKEESK